MRSNKTRPAKLWLLMVIAVVFWTIGTGFYRDLSAKSEEAYEELKIFSDVIELIEREYVDEVDTKELIQKAIQGMVQSLDPHSALLPLEAYEDLQIESYLNGDLRQSARTSDLIFPIPQLIGFISGVMTLYPGDLISTGTPSGIGPMKSGDRIEIRIEGIGSLVNDVL